MKAISNLKQTFVNNGYCNRTFDDTLHKYLETVYSRSNPDTPGDTTVHDVYYRNQYAEGYKLEERAIKSIIKDNTTINNEGEKLRLIVYYKSRTTKSMVSVNNMSPALSDLKKNNLVYEFNCTVGECEHREKSSYIGETTTSLSRRLTCHLASGAIKQHMWQEHNMQVTREELVENTSILRHESDTNRLLIFEALLILQKRPGINGQVTGSTRILKLYSSAPST